MESAQLQVAFEGGLLEDPNFPYDDFADAPKIFHSRPVLTSVLNSEEVTVFAQADIRYPGVNGPVVGVIRSSAQYHLRTDECGDAEIPVIVWIDFTISYFDC